MREGDIFFNSAITSRWQDIQPVQRGLHWNCPVASLEGPKRTYGDAGVCDHHGSAEGLSANLRVKSLPSLVAREDDETPWWKRDALREREGEQHALKGI